MATNEKLLVNEEWKKIYTTFRNVTFQSYDFDTLKRTMINAIKENYPEDFNDYIESSEFVALIDLISYLGQSLSYRIDINARENFIDTATRRESVIRLARLLSYNPKRNQCATGLLKMRSITTTENITDSNGRNISGITIQWNDPTNPNWYEQFIKIINAALPQSRKFGKPRSEASIAGIHTEQYKFNAAGNGIPLLGFNRYIDGRNTGFEIVPVTFVNSDELYEEPPYYGNAMSFLYRDDGKGTASANTGFFMLFKQGSLQQGDFTLENPVPNEQVDIDSLNINNSDVWLYELDQYGYESKEWMKVEATKGNNIIYNSLSKNYRKLYSVLTRMNDQVSLMFSDGIFGELPKGTFRAYYRLSNGLSYVIKPADMIDVNVLISYVSEQNTVETVSIVLQLTSTVNNSAPAETNESIKKNAPASFYTQNRMITGEDYNIFPLLVSQEIVKTKAVNRTSSGISRYFDLKDSTGKYSNTNIFGKDGVLYKEIYNETIGFSFKNKIEIENVILNKIQPIMDSKKLRDFYIENYSKITLLDQSIIFKQKSKEINKSTGYVTGSEETLPRRVGTFTNSYLKYVEPGALIKFSAPTGYYFRKNGELQQGSVSYGTYDKIWSKVVSVSGDGTAGGKGVNMYGQGPIVFNDIIPDEIKIDTILPKLNVSLDTDTRNKVIDLIYGLKTFGLRYDIETRLWKIVTDSNVNKVGKFSFQFQGDISNQNLDTSWLLYFKYTGKTYAVTYRALRYIFESKDEVRFFYDSSDKVYDSRTGKVIIDSITVLSINKQPDVNLAFNNDYTWEIIEELRSLDGYVDTRKIQVSFLDSDSDGVVDNPEIFTEIISPAINKLDKVVFQKKFQYTDGTEDYRYIPNDGLIQIYETKPQNLSIFSDGDLAYFYDTNTVEKFNLSRNIFEIDITYRAFIGRDNLKFQYVHSSDDTKRLDPSTTNFIDIYILTNSYDNLYRNWLKGIEKVKPLPLSSDQLYILFGNELNKYKSVTDEIIYHPVKYRPLFGDKAETSLQATFKVVKNDKAVVSDNDVKLAVLSAINAFFALEKWDFGDTFYFSELSAYVLLKVSYVTNIMLVPKQENQVFGSLFEIRCNSDEIFISAATINDIEIISNVTAQAIRAQGTIVSNVSQINTGILSQ